MLVEIYSDIVCPWCYIGQQQFAEALDLSDHGDEINVEWRAYQLDPRAGTEPTPVFAAYAKKYGGEDQAAAIIDRMTGAAAGVGLELRLDQALRVNTFDAHRLVFFAHSTDLQWEIERRLMEAYFVEGRNVADLHTLVELADDVGLDPMEAEEFLLSPDGRVEVEAELAGALERDVMAVPTFFFASQVGIPGAQDSDTFVRIIDRAVSRLSPEELAGDELNEDGFSEDE